MIALLIGITRHHTPRLLYICCSEHGTLVSAFWSATGIVYCLVPGDFMANNLLSCLRNLSAYKRPTSPGRYPRSRSAAVLVALFVGRGGDLYVLLSRLVSSRERERISLSVNLGKPKTFRWLAELPWRYLPSRWQVGAKRSLVRECSGIYNQYSYHNS